MTVVDYDAPRRSAADEESGDGLEEIRGRSQAQSGAIDVDEPEAELFELPGADLSGEEFTVRVIPQQSDEFVCSSCFLVQHRHLLVSEHNGVKLCRDCAD